MGAKLFHTHTAQWNSSEWFRHFHLHSAFAQQDADAVSDSAFESADYGHLKARGPPGADGDERLGGADGEVGGQRDDGGGDDGLDALHKEEGDDGDGRADVNDVEVLQYCEPEGPPSP